MGIASAVTMKAMVTRRSNPVARNPGKRSSRCLSPQRKCGEPVAEIDDAAYIAVRALLTRMRRDVLMQAVDVALGQRREDNPHKVSLLLRAARRALMRPRIASAGMPFAGSARYS